MYRDLILGRPKILKMSVLVNLLFVAIDSFVASKVGSIQVLITSGSRVGRGTARLAARSVTRLASLAVWAMESGTDQP